MSWFEPCILQNEVVRLEPFSLDFADELFPYLRVEDFQYWLSAMPLEATHDEWQEFLTKVVETPACVPLVVRSVADGKALGVSTFMDVQPTHRRLEIGMTWIAPPFRGSRVNPSMKYLMLEHAFERLDAVRVQLKTDARNLHSIAAITKLGAKREGTLRHYGVQRTGFVRDTVMFSILPDEWPEIKARLLDRIRL